MFFGEITQAEAMFLDIWLVLCNPWNIRMLRSRLSESCECKYNISFRVATLHALKIEEIWGDLRRNYKHFWGYLSKSCTKFEKSWGISHMYVLVNLTFTDVMTTNITVYSRRKTTFTVGEKWNLFMKLCNLHYIILTIWTHIICKWTNTLSH